MREQAKKVLREVYLGGITRALSHLVQRIRRKFGRIDREIIDKYCSIHGIRKLHIGCGENILDGWLNSDLSFLSRFILVHLDATERFPFSDEEFDYVFSEHVIEHFSYLKGLQMLSECHRILKPEGKIRISTPSLDFLIDLYKKEKSDLQIQYIKWAAKAIVGASSDNCTFVINNYVRDWGHQFIYDEVTLSKCLNNAGFTRVTRCELNESEDEALRNLEERQEHECRGF